MSKRRGLSPVEARRQAEELEARLLTPRCALEWPGCAGGKACAAHPSAKQAALLEELPYPVFAVLLGAAAQDDVIAANLLSRPLPGYALSHLVRSFAKWWDSYSYRSDQREDRFLRLLAVPALQRRDLVELVRVPVGSEALLALLEHPAFDHRVEAHLARVLSTRPGAVPRDVAPLLSTSARLAVSLGRLAPDLEAVELLKESRRALARFAHCPDAALETLEALSAEWDGDLPSLVDTCAALLARR